MSGIEKFIKDRNREQAKTWNGSWKPASPRPGSVEHAIQRELSLYFFEGAPIPDELKHKADGSYYTLHEYDLTSAKDAVALIEAVRRKHRA